MNDEASTILDPPGPAGSHRLDMPVERSRRAVPGYSPARRLSARPVAAKRARPLSIGIVLLDQFALSQFGLFCDVLRWAADEGDQGRPVNVRWFTMSPAPAPTRASCGTAVSPTSSLLDPAELDYVAIAGGRIRAALNASDELARYLRTAADAGVTLIGLCTAATLFLHRTGVMKGHCSCVSWYHYQDFLDHFPGEQVAADRLFLVDRKRITCAGGMATADLALHLVERHIGRATAQKAGHMLLVDRPRAGHEVQPHPPVSVGIREPRVRRAMLLMEQHLTRPLTIDGLARRLGLSLRQLERLFEIEAGSTPLAVYRDVRMRHAAWLLSHTRRSVTDIAQHAGFADCAHFSREFRRVFGLSPSQRRATSHGGAPPREGWLAVPLSTIPTATRFHTG